MSFRVGLQVAVAMVVVTRLLNMQSSSLLAAAAPDQSANGEQLTKKCTEVTSTSQGPYWVEENIHEANVRWNVSYGVPLNLTFRVVDGELSALYNRCVPIALARIDLWQCRYDGRYSDESLEQTQGEKWLRGYQHANSTGYATFYTIYPGWYTSRTVHIHVRIRLYNADNTTSYEDTTQLYFDDDISEAIYKNVYPYNQRGDSVRDTFNTNDTLFSSKNVITLSGDYNHDDGYSSVIEFALPFSSPVGLEKVSGKDGSNAPGLASTY